MSACLHVDRHVHSNCEDWLCPLTSPTEPTGAADGDKRACSHRRVSDTHGQLMRRPQRSAYFAISSDGTRVQIEIAMGFGSAKRFASPDVASDGYVPRSPCPDRQVDGRSRES